MPSVGALAIVGVTDRSMRSMIPASSSRGIRSSSDLASAAAAQQVGDHAEVDRGVRLDHARLSIHGSRGRTQQIASGSTPSVSSRTHGVGRGLARNRR